MAYLLGSRIGQKGFKFYRQLCGREQICGIVRVAKFVAEIDQIGDLAGLGGDHTGQVQIHSAELKNCFVIFGTENHQKPYFYDNTRL